MVDISLVAFDLDGTLLDARSRLRPDVKDAVARLHDRGVLVTIVTGRSFPAAAPYARELGLVVPIGTVHGALVRDLAGTEIAKRVIPEIGVVEILELAAGNDCVPIVVAADREGSLAICDEHKDHPVVRFTLLVQERGGELAGRPPSFLPREKIRLSAFAVYVIGVRDRISAFMQDASSEAVRLFNVERLPIHAIGVPAEIRDTHEVAMISPVGANKKTALEAIAETLGIPMEKVLAFGDWHNDVPMLRAAGYAVVMGNAPPGLARSIGHPKLFRTGHHDGSGIVDALARFDLL